MKKTTILIVDDEMRILRVIRANLLASDYEVLTASTGLEALEAFEDKDPDLVLLDIMLPDIDGFEVCRRIRLYSNAPIIMVTAKGDPFDVVKGLNAGVDDYIPKPFDIEELLARVRAVLRRTSKDTEITQVLSVGPIVLNPVEHQVKVCEREINLTPTEFKLLAQFLKYPGKVLTHEFLLTKVWGQEYQDETQYLRVTVGRLRNKLKTKSESEDYIVTIPSVGYRLISTLR